MPSRSSISQGRLSELFAENIVAKILRTAVTHLERNNPPSQYPEWVPQEGQDAGQYISRETRFWTCGFFPGSIYSLLERTIKFPAGFSSAASGQVDLSHLRERLRILGKTWSDPLHEMANRTDTHDMSFMIQPAMRQRWELLHDDEALASVVTAAESLYTRYSSKVGAIRSWNRIEQEGVSINDPNTNFLVIIDSMCNLDLLFYAAAQKGRPELAHAAAEHAHTLNRSLLREETHRKREGFSGTLYSTAHVVNFDPATGAVKQRRTRQGYSDESTWARGQAWGILGYAQTFNWTGDSAFLDAACGLAEYFLLRLEDAPASVERDVAKTPGEQGAKAGRYVPLWDFDAPVEADSTAAGPLRDSSAGVVAANGMLILAQTFAGRGDAERSTRYLEAALRIVDDTLALCLAPEKARLVSGADEAISGQDVESGKTFEAVLKYATVNYNQREFRRYADHGLVYGDYYLIEFGNRLLRYGLTTYKASGGEQSG